MAIFKKTGYDMWLAMDIYFDIQNNEENILEKLECKQNER